MTERIMLLCLAMGLAMGLAVAIGAAIATGSTLTAAPGRSGVIGS